MRFQQLVLILTDQLASTARAHIGRSTGRSTPPPVEASSGQEWQYDISTVRAHNGRSTNRSTPLVVASSGQEWQYDISTVRAHIGRSTGRSTPPPGSGI